MVPSDSLYDTTPRLHDSTMLRGRFDDALRARARRASSHQERRRRSRSSVVSIERRYGRVARLPSRESRRDPRGGSRGGGGGGRARGDAPRGASHAGACHRCERERGDDGERQDASKDGPRRLAVSKKGIENSLRSARTTVRRERLPPPPRSTRVLFDRGFRVSARLGRRRPTRHDRLAKAFAEPRERRERLEPRRSSKQETRGKAGKHRTRRRFFFLRRFLRRVVRARRGPRGLRVDGSRTEHSVERRRGSSSRRLREDEFRGDRQRRTLALAQPEVAVAPRGRADAQTLETRARGFAFFFSFRSTRSSLFFARPFRDHRLAQPTHRRARARAARARVGRTRRRLLGAALAGVGFVRGRIVLFSRHVRAVVVVARDHLPGVRGRRGGERGGGRLGGHHPRRHGDASRAGRCGTPRERLPGVRSEATQSISREQPKPNTWSRVIVFPTSTNLCECFPSAATGRRLGIQRDANTRCELAFYHLACNAIQQIRSIVRHARVGASRTCRDASSGPRRQTGRVDRGLAF